MTTVLCPFSVQVAEPGQRCTNWMHDGPHEARWVLLMPTGHHAAALCKPCYESLWAKPDATTEKVMGFVLALKAQDEIRKASGLEAGVKP